MTLKTRLSRLEASADVASVPTWAEVSAAGARILERARGKVAAWAEGRSPEPDPLADVDEAIVARYHVARGIGPELGARERLAEKLARMAAREVQE